MVSLGSAEPRRTLSGISPAAGPFDLRSPHGRERGFGRARCARRPAAWRSRSTTARSTRSPRRRRRRLLPRLPVPQGRRRSRSCTRTPTACARRCAAAPTGRFAAVSWDEAFARDRRAACAACCEHGGRNAVGVYLGNPTAHNLSAMLYGRVLLKALGTQQRLHGEHRRPVPKQLASALMFGSATTVAGPRPRPHATTCSSSAPTRSRPTAR